MVRILTLENRPFLSEANNFLIHCQQIKPAENHDGSTKITVDEVKNGLKDWKQIWDHTESFKLLWITDVLDQHATESKQIYEAAKVHTVCSLRG